MYYLGMCEVDMKTIDGWELKEVLAKLMLDEQMKDQFKPDLSLRKLMDWMRRNDIKVEFETQRMPD